MRKFKGIEVDETKVTIEESGDEIIIYNGAGMQIYWENSGGDWEKNDFDENNNEVYYENSNGFYESAIYDKSNRRIYRENSKGYWVEREYDKNDEQVYYEDSNGKIIGSRGKNEKVQGN